MKIYCKKLLSLVLAAIMIFSMNTTAQAATPNIDPAYAEGKYEVSYNVPEGAIILSESVETVYFNLENGEQISSEQASAMPLDDGQLFELKIKHTLYQVYGGRIDLGVDMTALNLLCRIKQIRGTMSMEDQDSLAASMQEIFSSTLVPTFRFAAYFEGVSTFSTGHTIDVDWTYYITLVNGYVLNGGKISSSNTVTIVR